MKYTNIYYVNTICNIGGIETFLYQLARGYKDIDLTIFYKVGDKNQINRLKKYVRCIKYTGEHIKCEKAFFNFNTDIIDNVEAKEYCLILHGDYKDMLNKNQLTRDRLPIHSKIDTYYGVSKLVCDSWKEITGIEAKLVYNPIEIDKPRKVLNLISATRLTREKGKDRMIKLAEMLNNHNIPYIWTIFTNDEEKINIPNVIYMKPRLDITEYIANADYLVQLSDNEGYCYSIIESLLVGTPVICTNVPVIKELGLNKTNSFILDFDMTNVPIEDIYNNKLSFTYIPKQDNWGDILVNKKTTYEEEKNMRYLVEATQLFTNVIDKDVDRERVSGEQWEISKERLEQIQEFNSGLIKVIEEIKPKEEKVEDKPKKKTTKKEK